MGQVLTINREQTNKQAGHNLLNTNIVGIKGAGGSRKRRAAGQSGGWSRWPGPPHGRLIRIPWCSGKRRIVDLDQDNQEVGIPSSVSRCDRNTQDTFPADKSRNLDVSSMEGRLKNKVAMVLEGSMVYKQKYELPVTTENIAVLCQTDVNSDKDKINYSGCWAQESVVSGAGDQQDEDLHQHHHQEEGRQLEPCGEPGHIVHDFSGHVIDNPGKIKTLKDSNLSVSGQAEQGPGARHHVDGARGGGSHDGDEGGPEPEGQQQLDPHAHPQIRVNISVERDSMIKP